jgi:nucleoredoxin
MDKVLGLKLVGKAGEVLTTTFSHNPYTLLYFSASWCPPCRLFTPSLINFYKQVNATQKLVEIALVSRDRTEQDFDVYFKAMPWLALPYEERALTNDLMSKYDVFTIPKLVLIDSEGKKLLDNCRDEVESSGLDALKSWSKAKYKI